MFDPDYDFNIPAGGIIAEIGLNAQALADAWLRAKGLDWAAELIVPDAAEEAEARHETIA